jgi:hypothetical protein
MTDQEDLAQATDRSELKARIFAAFEHACRHGEVEVADQLLAIINAKWVKPARGQQYQVPGVARTAPGRAIEARRLT